MPDATPDEPHLFWVAACGSVATKLKTPVPETVIRKATIYVDEKRRPSVWTLHAQPKVKSNYDFLFGFRTEEEAVRFHLIFAYGSSEAVGSAIRRAQRTSVAVTIAR